VSFEGTFVSVKDVLEEGSSSVIACQTLSASAAAAVLLRALAELLAGVAKKKLGPERGIAPAGGGFTGVCGTGALRGAAAGLACPPVPVAVTSAVVGLSFSGRSAGSKLPGTCDAERPDFKASGSITTGADSLEIEPI
jgi:hypothetical protein